MNTRTALLLPLGALAACFSPEAPVDSVAENGDGTTTAAESGTSDPKSTTDGPFGPDTEDAGTTDDQTTTDPTVSETGSGTNTTLGDSCTNSEDCDLGVCVDMECVPCGGAPDPDAACAEADSALPLCSDDGTACVACTADSCGGASPHCAPKTGCVACTEHSHCPESACHLGGPDQGFCFDTNDVVEVSDSTELSNAVDELSSGQQRVIRLLPGEYSALLAIGSGEELALLGGPGTTISDGATNTVYHQGGLLYIQGVHFDSGQARCISVSGGGELWLDDVSIENYGNPLNLTNGTTRIRRSTLIGDPNNANFGSIVRTNEGTTLYAENSDFGPHGSPAMSLGGHVDLRYVTVAGNTTGVACSTSATGQIRNSIIANPGMSDAGGCLGNLDFIDNASDEMWFGEDVGSYDAGWFVTSDGSRFFLSESGQEVFADIADWDEGDPLVDIEGDPRPTRERGYPGVDEP